MQRDKMEQDERAHWNTRYRDKPESWTEADELLRSAYAEHLHAASPGLALDIAGGAGRNSQFLLLKGWRVDLLDISEVGLELARQKASGAGVSANLRTERVDLNTVSTFGDACYDLITVFFFLRRELFPVLAAALRPGGLLIYKTYTTAQRDPTGGPRDSRYLLQPDELGHAFPALKTLHYQEKVQARSTAELIARK